MSFDKILRLFGIIVVILIFVLGGVVLFSNYFNYVPSNYRVIMGFLIISYGAFRLVSLFNKIKDDEED
jgi:ascorbate-specific PTS system EIIC-type component UlaA